MAALGLAPGIVVGLREGIEAALIIGLIASYLKRTDRGNLVKYVIFGLVAAIVASIITAGILVALSVGLEGPAEEIFEGVSAILAVTVLTFMIFWMMRVAKDVRGSFEIRVDSLAGRREVLGLVGLAFLAVFREGVETALFMLGVASATSTADAVAGVTIGILAASVIGLSLPRLSGRISIRRFFQVTSVVLIVMAAGLLSSGVHELQEASGLQAGAGQIYNLEGVFSSGEENAIGYLLHGIIGYSDSPTQLQVFIYFTYLAAVVLTWRYIVMRKDDRLSDKTQSPHDEGTQDSVESASTVANPPQTPALTDTSENPQ